MISNYGRLDELAKGSFPDLTRLSIISSADLTDEILLMFSNGKLKELKLVNTPNVSSKGLCTFLKANVGLTKVSLICLSEAEDALIADGLGHLKRLESVCLDGSLKLGNMSVNALASNCEFLTYLSMNGCAVDAGAIASVVKKCPKINSISAISCSNLSSEGLLNLSGIKTKLKILNLSLVPSASPSLIKELQNGLSTKILSHPKQIWEAPALLPIPEKKKKSKKSKK